MAQDLCSVDDVAATATISASFYRRDATEWESVSVDPIANGISTKANQVMARKLTDLENVCCFDCRKLAIENIDSLDFDCSSRGGLVRVMHELQ